MSDAPSAQALTKAGTPRQRRYTSQTDALANARRAAQHVKVGRPETYHPNLCERAVALGMLGKSWAAIARDFGVSRQTIHKWEADFPEFSDALARARAASQAWWEEHGQKNLKSKHYQAQVSKLVMSAQFEDYREANNARVDITLDLGSAIGEIEARRRPAQGKVIDVEAQASSLPAPADSKDKAG